MRLAIANEIIERMDVVKEEEVFIRIKTKDPRDDIILGIELMQLMLKLLGKKALSGVKNVPVRMIGEDQGDGTMRLIALGHIREDEWVDMDFESEIVSFEELLKVRDISEAGIMTICI